MEEAAWQNTPIGRLVAADWLEERDGPLAAMDLRQGEAGFSDAAGYDYGSDYRFYSLSGFGLGAGFGYGYGYGESDGSGTGFGLGNGCYPYGNDGGDGWGIGSGYGDILGDGHGSGFGDR